MRIELRQVLLQWRNDNDKIGVRTLHAYPNPNYDGEYYITLKEEIQLGINGQSQRVVAAVRFATYSQANNGVNPQGDLHRAKRFINTIVQKFDTKYSEALNDLLGDYLGDEIDG